MTGNQFTDTSQNILVDYPDVLGMITGGVRLNVEAIQCALAIYPRTTALMQAVEALVLLQNTCNKPIQATVSVRLPRKDAAGNRLSLNTPKEIIPVTIQAGETGLLHIPILPNAPTQPGAVTKISVHIDARTPRGSQPVRPVEGGRPASMLSMSPMRLSVLREVGFLAQEIEAGSLVDTLTIIPGQVAAAPAPNAPRYEVLWSEKEFSQEQARYAQLGDRALQLAGSLTRIQIMQPLMMLTTQRFQQAGFPLMPVEALFIAKTLTYVMEDGLETEEGFSLKGSRWFYRLMNSVTDMTLMGDIHKLVAHVYIDALHDAVEVGLSMVQRVSKENLGTREEQVGYANEVQAAIEGKASIDLSHAYLPLILAGMLLNADVRLTRENLWSNLTQIKDAWQARINKSSDQHEWMAKIVGDFLYYAEATLNEQHIPRPH